MHLRSLALPALGAVSLLLAACPAEQQSTPPVRTGTLVRPITNGTLDSSTAHAAVVYLEVGYAACTGTLITPTVVMTAAHCVYDENGNVLSPQEITVGFGTYVGSSMSAAGVVEVQPHPDYDTERYPYDIALLRLDRTITNVTPIPYLPPSLALGSSDVNSTTLVFSGYGITESGDSPYRRLKVSDTLGYVCTNPGGCNYIGEYAAPFTICYDQQPGGPCSGDSGGPAFVTRNGVEYVAGVTSYGDQDCVTFGCSTKVDVFQSFIEGFIGGSKKENGESCSAASECASGFCVDGVCCNTACSAGACDACSRAAGGTADGVCAPRNGVSCNDSDRCTTNDTCSNFVCRGTEVVCSAPDTCHNPGICNSGTGECSAATPKINGMTCDDGNLCTMVDSCQEGACVGSNPVRCNPPDACHIPSGCEPDTGACTYSAADDGTSCDDSNPCTINDSCAGGTCAGTPNTCEPDGCHQAGMCDQVTGQCINPVLPDGTDCGDGTCKAGICEASGCGCSSGAGAATWALFLAPALALVRRRRRS